MRRTSLTRALSALCCAGVLITGATILTPRSFAEEPEDRGSYYEDDAWYDISEWFDGNDYNPTDEAFGRIDDETFDTAEERGFDQDNDTWFGYNENSTDDDWFYDYYDPGYNTYWDLEDDNTYEYTSRYYDFDNDGSYDAFVSYTDTDEDGDYEQYTYYFLNDKGTKKQRDEVGTQKPKSSKRRKVTGTIENVKKVKVRGGEHLVVSIKMKDETLIVDLGQAKNVKNINLKKGDEITASGPMAKVGQKEVLLANRLNAKDKQIRIDRKSRTLTGSVTDTHKRKVRGTERLFAMVKMKDSGKTIAVDFGPADKLDVGIKKGSQLTFTAIPVKVKGKRFLLAKSVEHGGKSIQIDRRRSRRKGAKASS